MIGETWSFVAAGMIVVSSAIYYADMGIEDGRVFLLGFPVVSGTWWILTLFVIQASEATAMAVVLVSVFLTFPADPLLHPVRVKRLRRVNLAIFLLWCALSGYSLILNFIHRHGWSGVWF